MRCPKCEKRMKLSKTYTTPQGQTKGYECRDLRCGTAVTALVLVVVVDPGYGDGAYSLAQRMKEGQVRVDVIRED